MTTQNFTGGSIRDTIRNLNLCDFNTVFCQFYDPENSLVNVASGTVTVRSARYDPTDPDGLIINQGTLTNFTTGTYYYKLVPDDLEPGFYSLQFDGTLTSAEAGVTGYNGIALPTGLCVEGQVQVQERTAEMDFTLRVRRRLKDLNTRLYRLDLPVQKWPDDEIIDAVNGALDEINVTPPMRTNYSYNTLPTGVRKYIIDIAFCDLLESQAIFENAQTFNMNDGAASLSLQRAQLYSSQANAARTRIDQKVAKWKRSLVPNMHGQGTNQYPFQIRHVISFLPNFKNIFGG